MIDGLDGLEGIVAAETVLSEVDGEAGRLVIRGRSLDQLSGQRPFEDVVHLLFDGFFDDLPRGRRPGRRPRPGPRRGVRRGRGAGRRPPGG